MSDLISRQAAIDGKISIQRTNGVEIYSDEAVPVKYLKALPSAQPKHKTEFMKLTVRDINGKPYYSIIYLEFDDNGVGHDFEGYSSYSLDVISDYLKKYFMPSVQLQREKGKWIWCGDKHVCSECDGFALCDAYDVLDTGEYQEKLIDYCPHCGSDMRGEQDEVDSRSREY